MIRNFTTARVFRRSYTWLHWRTWRFLQLLVFIVAVLMLNPLQSSHPLLVMIMHLLVLNGMVVSLSAAGFAPSMRGLLFGIWALSVGLDTAVRWYADSSVATALSLAAHFTVILLLLGCIVATLRYVLLSRKVTTDSISAAIVAYFFIGLVFASAYYCLVVLDARSFTIPPDMPVAGPVELETSMIYYSYVTLATLGYGDIAPRLPVAQMLAVIEAVIGQFYIAIVIAWLVSVYAAGRVAPGGAADPKENSPPC